MMQSCIICSVAVNAGLYISNLDFMMCLLGKFVLDAGDGDKLVALDAGQEEDHAGVLTKVLHQPLVETR